jgi:hypothetical protein
MVWVLVLILVALVVWLITELLKAQRDVELLRESHEVYRAAKRIQEETEAALQAMYDEAGRSPEA